MRRYDIKFNNVISFVPNTSKKEGNISSEYFSKINSRHFSAFSLENRSVTQE